MEQIAFDTIPDSNIVAIARRDPEAAGAAMDAHFDASIADILKADAAVGLP